ncbi:MAG: hypothetical protein AAGJ40_14755 [Planctomycetota bacterium]
MIETSVRFGPKDHLAGVIRDSSPWRRDATLFDQERVGVVMLTAGMLPSSGPYRLHVDLAGALARLGLPSVRFDLSGIGESFSGPDPSASSLQRAVNETVSAMDLLEARTCSQRFILYGLCSGADDAMQVALSDPRVVGLVTIDGFGYRTLGYHARRWFRDLPRKAMTQQFWRRRWRHWRGADELPPSLRGGEDVREYPSRATTCNHLRRLVRRGVSMHFAYTGGIRETINHAGQFDSMFPEFIHERRITHRFFESMDHTAMLKRDRDVLMRHLVEQIAHTAVASNS